MAVGELLDETPRPYNFEARSNLGPHLRLSLGSTPSMATARGRNDRRRGTVIGKRVQEMERRTGRIETKELTGRSGFISADKAESGVTRDEKRRLQECLAALFADANAVHADPAGVETYGEGVERVSRVPVRENGEPLVNLPELDLGIRFATSHPWSTFPRVYWVWQSVAEMLATAQSGLPAGIQLELLEGYRPLRIQRRLFAAAYHHLRVRHPRWTAAQLREAANVLVADPTVAPPPHSTGGAIDVFLVDSDGLRLDMNSPLPWSEASAPTKCEGLSATARANRRLLIDALAGAGLTNYPGEWWHWSYGEPGWALRTSAAHAFYGPVEPPRSFNGRVVA
jgi:D-alanyl-D-alanine dipeptidase